MAKKEAVEAQAAAATEAQAQAPAATEATKAGGAAIVLASGERRIDYIRRRYKEGAKRGEIAKELGVKYQIVFAATKELKGEAQAPAAAAPAAEGQAAA